MLKFSALLLPVFAAVCDKDVADYPGTCQEEAAFYGQTMDEFLNREDCNDFDALLNTDTCETGCCRIDEDFFRNGRKSASKENRIWKPRVHGFKGVLLGAKRTDDDFTAREPQWIQLNSDLNIAKRNSNKSPEDKRIFAKYVKEKLLGLMVLYFAHDPKAADIVRPNFLDAVDQDGRPKVINEVVKNIGWPTFSSFTDYGCWCFQRKNFVPSFTAGSKGAFDTKLDAACRKRALNTKCATCDDYTNPCYEETGYEFESVEGDAGREISCKNAEDTCAYNNCVIDIRFAKEAATALRNMPAYNTAASQLMTGYIKGGIALTRQEMCVPVGKRPTVPPPAPQAPAAQESASPVSTNNEAASSDLFEDAEATTEEADSQGTVFFTDNNNEVSLGSTADQILDLAADLATAGDTDSDTDSNRPRPSSGNNNAQSSSQPAQSSTQSDQSSSQSNQSSSQSDQSSSQSNQATEPVNPSQDQDIDSQPSVSEEDGNFLDDLLTDSDTFANAEAVTDSAADEFVLTYTDDNSDYMDDTSFNFADDHYDYSYDDADSSDSFTVSDEADSSDYAELISQYEDVIDTIQVVPQAPAAAPQEQVGQQQVPIASMYTGSHHHNYITHDELKDFDDDDDKQCCGDYPERFPIVESDHRQCCGTSGEAYNPNQAICCEIGVVRNSEGMAEGEC